MEQSIPSFQSFVRRTPTPEAHKPLPPTPLRPRRPSSFKSIDSRPSSRFTRRSFSVYSRRQSEWSLPLDDPEDIPAVPTWRLEDLADQNLLLRPIAYSASTSQLATKASTQQQTLEPRAYSPLIVTSSPTASRKTTPSPAPSGPQENALLPPPAGFMQVPKKHLRTVSLEKAKEMLQAPGAIRLLPEELRAQKQAQATTARPLSTLIKSRSQEPLRKSSSAMIGLAHDLARNPTISTLIDTQGRERVVSIPRIALQPISPPLTTPSTFATLNTIPSHPPTYLRVGTGPAKDMAPLSSQTREASRAKAAQALGLADADEPRGRTKTRGPRDLSYDHYLPSTTTTAKQESGGSDSDGLGEEKSDARKIAREYHAMLSAQYRSTSTGSAVTEGSSEMDVGAHMKMVPQPLFGGKGTAQSGGGGGNGRILQRSQTSVSPGHVRNESTASTQSMGSQGSFPLPLSFSQGPTTAHRRRSTSGMIPISPPTPTTAALPLASNPFVTSRVEVTGESQWARQREEMGERRRRRGSEDDERVSTHYPHVMPRRKKSDKVQEGRRDRSPGGSWFERKGSSKVRERPRSPGGSPFRNPLASNPPAREDAESGYDSRPGKPFQQQRVMDGGAKYNKPLTLDTTQPRSSEESQRSHGSLASPTSPPFALASPASPIHLGWSETAKTAFDESRSSFPRSSYPPATQTLHPTITSGSGGAPRKPTTSSIQSSVRTTYLSLPGSGRTSADSRNDVPSTQKSEPESPGRRPSIFAGIGLMESWREGKAEKRRRELKGRIRVVTGDGSGCGEGGEVGKEKGEGDGQGEVRPGLVGRRLSAFGWM
ncbi:hypothetical protein LTR86_003933 [Recurvomyces mirabilis]|nr:hypothetical protein LTR86_003933 [Recurvomyces mirabilis]